jgi:hypothetical protein
MRKDEIDRSIKNRCFDICTSVMSLTGTPRPVAPSKMKEQCDDGFVVSLLAPLADEKVESNGLDILVAVCLSMLKTPANS